MTIKELTAITRGIAPAIMATIKKGMAPLDERLRAVEARLERLESTTKGVEYKGIFERDRLYPAGCLVTRSGGLWLSTCETFQTPGSGDTRDWKLIVKSGGLTENKHG